VGLHSTICILKKMLVELCVSDYATSNGFVNGANGIFKTSTTYCEKTIIWCCDCYSINSQCSCFYPLGSIICDNKNIFVPYISSY